MQRQLGKRWCGPTASACLLICVASMSSAPVEGANLEVDCDGGPAPYHTILDAMASLSPSVPWHPYAFHDADTIRVRGTCVENLVIYDRKALTIEAPTGETFTVVDPSGSGTTVWIGGSQGVYISGMVVSGGTSGIVVFDASEVDLDGCVIDDQPSFGIDVQGNSMVFLLETSVQNNGSDGILIDDDSNVGLFAGTQVSGNGRWGVNSTAGGMTGIGGAVQFSNNGSIGDPMTGGIRLARGSVLRLSANTSGRPEFTQNLGPAILVDGNSTALLQDAAFENNAAEGVRVRHMSVAEFQGDNSFTLNLDASISCDSTSLVFGDLTGVVGIQCQNVENQPSEDTEAGQETLCHCPQGNTSNCHTITIGTAAASAHIAHGDSIGSCVGDSPGPDEAITATAPSAVAPTSFGVVSHNPVDRDQH